MLHPRPTRGSRIYGECDGPGNGLGLEEGADPVSWGVNKGGYTLWDTGPCLLSEKGQGP